MTVTITIVSAWTARFTMPSWNSWLSASMSLVMRVITRPAFSSVKKSMRQPLQVCEDADPQVVEQRLADLACPCDPEAARDHADDDADRVQHRGDDEHLRRLGEDALVDAALGQQRTGLHRQRLDEHEREGAGHRRACGSRGTGAT